MPISNYANITVVNFFSLCYTNFIYKIGKFPIVYKEVQDEKNNSFYIYNSWLLLYSCTNLLSQLYQKNPHEISLRTYYTDNYKFALKRAFCPSILFLLTFLKG